MTTKARRQAILRELAFRKAFRPGPTVDEQFESFKFYCKTFARIKVADVECAFLLRDSQAETARHLLSRENIIVLKARQIGFSTLFANFSLWQALVKPNFTILFLSSKEDEAVYLLGHAKYAYDRLPMWVRERLPALIKDRQQEVKFANASSITSLQSRKDAARGRTASLLVADEFASLQDQEEAWAAMLPATDVGGQVVVLSTAKGSGDLFESLWNRARQGRMKFTPLFWSWRTAFNDAWYENKKKELLPWQLAQEHPSDADEAFIRSGNAVFDLDTLKKQKLMSPMHGEFTYIGEHTGKFREMTDGPMRLWETPEEGVKYVVGVDLAEGLEHGDRSVAIVLRGDNSELAAIYTTNSMAPWQFAQLVAELGWWYNKALVGPERNNHGHAFIRSLVEYGYHPIYRNFRKTKLREQVTEELGWLTTPKSKAYLINKLDEYIMLPDEDGYPRYIVDEITVNEMKTYKKNERGAMSGSPFDDHVMAYAIALEMTNYVYEAKYREQAERVPVGSLAWYDKESFDKKSGPRIGDHEQKSLVS